jgi:hypothetical protein
MNPGGIFRLHSNRLLKLLYGLSKMTYPKEALEISAADLIAESNDGASQSQTVG